MLKLNAMPSQKLEMSQMAIRYNAKRKAAVNQQFTHVQPDSEQKNSQSTIYLEGVTTVNHGCVKATRIIFRCRVGGMSRKAFKYPVRKVHIWMFS